MRRRHRGAGRGNRAPTPERTPAPRPPGSLNVLLVTPFYPPVVSGAGRYGADIAVGMAQRGHHVTVLTGGDRPGMVDLDGVTVERVAGPFRGATSMRIAGRALIRHRREPYDLIVSGVAFPMGVVGAILARTMRRPLAVLAMGEDVSVGEVSRMARWCLRHVFVTRVASSPSAPSPAGRSSGSGPCPSGVSWLRPASTRTRS